MKERDRESETKRDIDGQRETNKDLERQRQRHLISMGVGKRLMK